jgi:cytochrome c oxidase accessory protein FixG
MAAGRQAETSPVTTVLDKRDNPEAKPAFGVDRHDVEAVNAKDKREQYASRQKIYPKLATGTFRNVKWLVMAATLTIYYALPWMRWSRGPDLPNQAVLLDMANNRFFFFFLEIWPQEFYYVTGLLLLASLALFLVTSAAGRVWCGYSCPQTVWTDLMITVERLWQGDRNARIRLDKEPWGTSKIFKKVMTHLSWLLIGLLTGGAMVFYFRDAPTLARELVTGTAPAIAYLFLAIFTGTTYVLGGIAREQVCIYMCPWPRIQGAMTDQHTLLVSYRVERGEPRGPARKGPGGVVDWSTRGDCIDCNACVAVCPTGIDIRDGSQLECIQCALCIDACDSIMDKIGRPRGLIAYDTVARKEAASAGLAHEPVQLIRARTMLYAGLFALVGIVMLVAWSGRSVLELNVIADRNPPYVRLSSGAIRNGFTMKILNKLHEPRTYTLRLHDLPGGKISILGMEDEETPAIKVPTDVLREIRVFVSVPSDQQSREHDANRKFHFIVRDQTTGLEVSRKATFQGPSDRTGEHHDSSRH